MLTESDKQILFKLAEELTGCAQSGDMRQDSLIGNVERRMSHLKLTSLASYLQHVENHSDEFAHLISSLTIHTTSWFRENPHFVVFQELLLEALDKNETFKVWCSACSTGEEVYSFALMLEEFRRVHPKFDYRILGTDIDPVSIAIATKAVYAEKQINFHLNRYRAHMLIGSGKSVGFFTICKEIRNRCIFRVHDLRTMKQQPEGPFHVCICRNVLIYFSSADVARVVKNLLATVRHDGHLFLGHSEAVNGADFGLVQRGHSVFCKQTKEREPSARSSTKYRILSIDDSSATRKFLTQLFAEMGFESVTVKSASEATSYLNFNEVDLITLDLHMPGIRGDEWLISERKEGLKTPIVILSDTHASDADAVVRLLEHGAQHYMEKEHLRTDSKIFKEVILELIHSHQAPTHGSTRVGGGFPSRAPELVLIGASTGGPQALVKLLANMPPSTPPIMITQHMAPKFTRPLAERLASLGHLRIGSMEVGSPMLPGHIYMAYSDHHIGVDQKGGKLFVTHSNSHAVNGHRPSVDFMFNSVIGVSCPMMAILLTGMGRDGALGLRFLRKEGVFCIAQSEEDCVVYGMPREAIERDGADFVGNVDEIRKLMLSSFELRTKKASA